MDEGKKLTAAIEQAKSARAAVAGAEQREAYEYDQKRSQNIYEMREKLKEITAAYAGPVRVKFSELPSSLSHRFVVDIGNTSGLIRKPYGALEVRVTGSGFGVSDRFQKMLGRYVPITGSFDSAEAVAHTIRDVAAHYIALPGPQAYEPAEWMDHSVAVLAFLVGIGVFGLCVMFWGWIGLVMGGFLAFGVFKLVQAIGPITLVPVLACAIYFLLSAAT